MFGFNKVQVLDKTHFRGVFQHNSPKDLLRLLL